MKKSTRARRAPKTLNDYEDCSFSDTEAPILHPVPNAPKDLDVQQLADAQSSTPVDQNNNSAKKERTSTTKRKKNSPLCRQPKKPRNGQPIPSTSKSCPTFENSHMENGVPALSPLREEETDEYLNPKKKGKTSSANCFNASYDCWDDDWLAEQDKYVTSPVCSPQNKDDSNNKRSGQNSRQGATPTESYSASLDLAPKSFSPVKDASRKTPFPSPSVKDLTDLDSEFSRDDDWSAPPVLVSCPKASGKNARISQMRLLAKAQKKSANSKNQTKLPRTNSMNSNADDYYNQDENWMVPKENQLALQRKRIPPGQSLYPSTKNRYGERVRLESSPIISSRQMQRWSPSQNRRVIKSPSSSKAHRGNQVTQWTRSDSPVRNRHVQAMTESQFHILNRDIQYIKVVLKELADTVESQVAKQPKIADYQIPGFKFPLTSMKELLQLNARLSRDEDRLRLVGFFSRTGGTTANAATYRAMPKLMTNQLATTITWTGRSYSGQYTKNKFESIPKVFSALCDGLRCNERLSKTDDDVFEDCVKEWLRHAGDRLKTENKNRNGYQDL